MPEAGNRSAVLQITGVSEFRVERKSCQIPSMNNGMLLIAGGGVASAEIYK
jgi:hypothetical protein